MNRPGTIKHWIIYALLVCGAVVFSFPFLWMVSTALKSDRELYSGAIDLVPERPDPRAQSPYFSPSEFPALDEASPQARALLPMLRQRVTDAANLPPAANRDEAARILSAGLFESLRQRTPPSIWDGDPDALLRFAQADTTPDRVAAVAQRAHRQFGIGPIRARNVDLHEEELSANVPPERRWNNQTPAVATLSPAIEHTLPYAAVAYDFSRGDRVVLSQAFDLPFPADQLQRLTLRVRPDDTWHGLSVTVEAAGVRYVAERAAPLAETGWLTLLYQKRSPDDYSTKIKKWLVLEETARSPQFDHGPNRIHVTLELRRATPASAAYAKAQRNYYRVRDYIPFWRYVRVSVLLVVLNIVLTLLSSSLVAYAFARLQWPGRNALFIILLGTMMIPGQVTMIPHFLIWKSVGAFNTLTPLWAGAALGNAFFIFLMRQFLKGIPTDLEDAARIDGCGFLRIWWHVMLPLVKPSLAAIAIFTFMATWNDFLTPLIYIADQRLYPLAFGLYAFSVQVDNSPVLTMGASLLMTIPVIAVFFAAQRYFIAGITLTGMKG